MLPILPRPQADAATAAAAAGAAATTDGAAAAPPATREALQPELTFNPQVARVYAAVAARASDNSIYAPVAPLPAAVAAYLYPDGALQRAAAPAVRAFRATAGPLLKRGRGDKAEELLAGRRLYADPGGASGAGDDAGAAAAAAAGEQVEAAAATVSKRPRKAAAGEDEAAAAAAAESADALLAAKKLDAGVFNVGGGSGSGGGGGRRGAIGTGDPVGDFHAALRGGRASEDVIDAAIDGLAKAVSALAGDPLGHAKGVAALAALRAACVQYYASRSYNDLLRGMLADATAAAATGAPRPTLTFLGAAVSSTRASDGGVSLTLINRDECPDETRVTEADSVTFVGRVEAALVASRGGGAAAPAGAADTGGGAGGGGDDEEYAFE
jgi:hypothetical protein